MNRVVIAAGDKVVSYLPYTHSFEQALFGWSCMMGLQIGFYTGDPAKLAADCQVLHPDFFPSVPRLYNKMYSKVKSIFDSATGCKRWLINKAVAAKTAN